MINWHNIKEKYPKAFDKFLEYIYEDSLSIDNIKSKNYPPIIFKDLDRVLIDTITSFFDLIEYYIFILPEDIDNGKCSSPGEGKLRFSYEIINKKILTIYRSNKIYLTREEAQINSITVAFKLFNKKIKL